MEEIVVDKFLKFFQDYINLCLFQNWPNDRTSAEEIRNAFKISQHIEKCLDKFQKRSLIDEFLTILNNKQTTSTLFLQNCFSDPPKYILKKILNSSTNITQVDVGFNIFIEFFSEEKLEEYLSDFMLEAASKEILLKNLTELPKDSLLEFKSKYFLSEINEKDHSEKIINDMLNNCTRDNMDILIQGLLNKDLKYIHSVDIISKVIINFMSIENVSTKMFWKLLFDIDEVKFLQICLNHGDIFKLISKALVNSGKLIRNKMSMEDFYVDLTFSQLGNILKVISKNENLKLEFLESFLDNNDDFTFWNNIMT